MLIKNTADLDQQIIILERQEVAERQIVMEYVITPGAAIHTMTGLLMSWVRSGRNRKGKENRFGILKLIGALTIPLTLLPAIIRKSSPVFRPAVLAAVEMTRRLISKEPKRFIDLMLRILGVVKKT